jgi:hypothetical protein
MSMHLCGPELSLNGRKKGRVKFRNAAEAARARELEADWRQLKSNWGVEEESRRRARAMTAEPLTYKLTAPVGRETARIESRDTGHTGAVAMSPAKVYTGEECIGIGQLHKSNSVPVFKKQDAEDIAKMRRN